MSRFEKLVLFCVIALFGAGIVMGLIPKDVPLTNSADTGHNTHEKAVVFPLELNKATASDLKAIKGIGDAKARWIIEYREKQGAFTRVDDLLNVTGIGPKTLESIRTYLYVDLTDSTSSSGDKIVFVNPQNDTRIDINRADFDELLTLPGIGEVKAQRILEYRQNHGVFHDINELLQVSGIGNKTLEQLKPLITCEN
jgi:competence protein ComEA